jgi:beta-glucosidase
MFSKAHQDLALEAARKSIILLKNDKKLLPLKSKKILVTGPNADNQRILGDWTVKQPDENITTVYEGIKEVFKNSKVEFINSGESLRNPSPEKLKQAVDKAADFEAIIVVVGSNSLRFENKDKTCGENVDRAGLNLMGNQLQLIRELYEINKNIIVVFVNGRPLAEPWIKENIPAIIEAWEPGSFGGRAIAEIIHGDVNPSGKLTMSIPYSVGQLVYTYNHKNMHHFRNYVDEPSMPLWHFGYGLSYTDFQYSEPETENVKIQKTDSIKISLNVSNTGSVAGDEIVQLYIRDNYSSITRPVKELKAYKRINLEPGETKEISFELPPQVLGFYNKNMDFVIEPGEFTLMTGCSSKDEDLKSILISVE